MSLEEVSHFFGPQISEDQRIQQLVAAGQYYADAQPDFGPGHIKTPGQLNPGDHVEVLTNRGRGPFIERVEVVGAGLRFNQRDGLTEDPTQWSWRELNGGQVQSGSLATDGLVAFARGVWQQHRYVRRAVND